MITEDPKKQERKAKSWINAIKKAGKTQEKEWEKKAEKVVHVYRDDNRSETDSRKQMNFLWSNVETLKPALYSNLPKPQVSRRFKDSDPLGRHASMVLERALEFSIESYPFDNQVKQCVEDYLLPGRGLARVVYNPIFEQTTKDIPLDIGENESLSDEDGNPYEGEVKEVDGNIFGQKTIEDKAYESVECQYVYWKDFRHGPGRTWDEVPWVAFRNYYTKAEGVKEFGNNFLKINIEPKNETDDSDKVENKGETWEIWDKTSGMVFHVAEGFDEAPLRESEPPLKFEGFFPIPEPLVTFKTNGSLVPIPEYCFYQDQAEEINDLTARIGLLVEAVKVAGLYAGDSTEIADLLNNDNENKLVAVSDWAMFAERGGIDGAISWYPVDQVIKVVVSLYEARDKTKQELYEITGLSDIIRGASDAGETATAQRIKGQFASLRLSDRQSLIQKFIRDLLRLKAEVIAEHFEPQTLALMSGMEVSDQVVELLRNDALRRFKIEIETDSTIQVDEEADKASRVEFLGMTSKFLTEVFPLAGQLPEITPLLGEMLMFSARGFRSGRQLEEKMEEFVDIMMKKAANPPPPQPNPDVEKAKAELEMKGQEHQQNMQMKQQEHQQDMAHEQETHKLEVIKSIHQAGQ